MTKRKLVSILLAAVFLISFTVGSIGGSALAGGTTNASGPPDIESIFRQLVSDGALTQQQSDGLKVYMQENRPDPGDQKAANPVFGAVAEGIISQEQAELVAEAMRGQNPAGRPSREAGETSAVLSGTEGGYPIVDTNQTKSYTKTRGEDADYTGNQPSYTDNRDGTVTDNVTGLMWQSGFTLCTYDEAQGIAETADTAGYDDWRVPTIKELYSLIEFTGSQGTSDPSASTAPKDAAPFLDTEYFNFEYPDMEGYRYIDAQYISSTEYVYYTMDGNDTFFGVNFADGRIKGYPMHGANTREYYLRLVRGNEAYGNNNFADNQDGTVSDTATGLMWAQADSGADAFEQALSECINDDGSMNWEEALAFAENADYAGYDDWRLPNAKELQSLVDYTRSPDTTDSAAISELFGSTPIVNEMGEKDFAYYWTGTSFNPGNDAVYIAFGRALGYFHGSFMDVHGAGSQKTDPKEGSGSYGNGPQGDVRRVYNYVRLVRDID